jgi:hypothetical protein
MRVLVLPQLNRPRLELLVAGFLRDGALPGPRAMAAAEDLTPPPLRFLADAATGDVDVMRCGALWRRAACGSD